MNDYNYIKNRVYQIIEKAENGDKTSLRFDYFIVTLIFLNVVAIILESYNSIYSNYSFEFRVFEIISVFVFTVEYILRIWTSDIEIKESSKIKSIVKSIISPMVLIDLLAILPFYLPMLIPFDLRFLRMIRIIRFFRLFKLNRYSKSLKLVGTVLKKKKSELFVTIFVTFILLLIASTLMYYIENKAQPEVFPNIITSFWWAIATLTTVGYGDVYPVTAMGRLLSGIIAFLGIGLVALPTGIISSGFMEEINDNDSESDRKYCPYCGKRLDK
ncbi:MAG: ion transporter [Firmicutes bacterium]|nr:ion transporter [Bacillota bacterium]